MDSLKASRLYKPILAPLQDFCWEEVYKQRLDDLDVQLLIMTINSKQE